LAGNVTPNREQPIVADQGAELSRGGDEGEHVDDRYAAFEYQPAQPVLRRAQPAHVVARTPLTGWKTSRRSHRRTGGGKPAMTAPKFFSAVVPSSQ
jgi:hypothetical protein